METKDRFRGCLLGLAVGDAVGTTLEFKPAGSFKPIRDMVGGGPFRLKPGEWTDDTSMALCLATSLVETNGFDPKDQMDRYCRWWKEGYLSSNGVCFDIGNTVSAALRHFGQTGDPIAGPTSPRSADNGSIMRLAPVPMFYYPDVTAAIRYSAESSRTTHGAPECIDACRLLAGIICRAISGASKEDVLFGEADSRHQRIGSEQQRHDLNSFTICPESPAHPSLERKQQTNLGGFGRTVKFVNYGSNTNNRCR